MAIVSIAKGFIKRLFSYNGSLQFISTSDEIVRAGYQHKFVVERYIGYLKNKRVLDAGCWTAPIARELSDRGIELEFVGLDENESALEIARKNFSRFKFLHAALTKPQESFAHNYRNYFDCVIFLDVLEHLPVGSEKDTIRFLGTLLKPGGVIVMSTMADHPFNIIDPAWFFGHRHYKLKTCKAILQDSGFQIIELLKNGNLYWDLDLLFFYIHKHIFRKHYQTSIYMQNKIMKGFNSPKIPTRFYFLARKCEGIAV